MKEDSLSPIEEFYEGKSIFITGATGLVGKVLLEKLLRCCRGISHIYLMARERRGKTAEDRINDLFSLELFDLVKKEYPTCQKKVSVIYGNLEDPALAINPLDVEKLQKNVNIIFHTAARVRWDNALKQHVQCQIIATKFLLEMMKSFEKIEAFVYVSSAAVHSGRNVVISERIPEKGISATQLVNASAWMDGETLNAFLESLRKKETIVYLLTKTLTEKMIEENHGDVSTVIIRPPMVTATYKDPFPGWCDALQSLQGIGIAVAKGVLRTIYLPNKDNKFLLVPADVFVNSVIASAWFVKNNDRLKSEEVFIVNSGISFEKMPVFSKEFFKGLENVIHKYPLSEIFRYPTLTVCTSSKYWHKMQMFFDEFVPAVIVDALLYISSRKTFMVNLHKKLHYMLNTMSDMWPNVKQYKMENHKLIESSLSEKDSKVFFMDIKDFNWSDYLDTMVLKARKILAKEDISNLQYATRKAKMWKIVTTILKWCVILYFVNLLYTFFF